jgi:hypothetical protein
MIFFKNQIELKHNVLYVKCIYSDINPKLETIKCESSENKIKCNSFINFET